mmetsp:Transcript_1852/g.2256  ORF Transcript_1852/g.2256 Transcript_1852/m.2256 type:complete len:230 (+) Transcript_1852:482-1171(+)
MGVTNASHGDDHPADILGHDHAFDDEDPSRLGAEAVYCRAAADSHADSCTHDDPDSAEAGSAPFKGQGSVIYSYRESSKLRFGTLNAKGSLQGAAGGDTFMADVVRTFETYGVDVLGVTGTGTQQRYSATFKKKVVAGLEKKGLHCMWGMPDPFQQNLGVMLIHRKGINMKEVFVDGPRSGRVLAGELTRLDKILSKEVKTVVVVLYGFTGMTTERVPPAAIKSFNMMY